MFFHVFSPILSLFRSSQAWRRAGKRRPQLIESLLRRLAYPHAVESSTRGPELIQTLWLGGVVPAEVDEIQARNGMKWLISSYSELEKTISKENKRMKRLSKGSIFAIIVYLEPPVAEISAISSKDGNFRLHRQDPPSDGDFRLQRLDSTISTAT